MIIFQNRLLSGTTVPTTRKDCHTVALEVGMQNDGLASNIAASTGKIATVGLAAAVNGPLMNTVFSIISTWWGSKPIKDRVSEKKAVVLSDL